MTPGLEAAVEPGTVGGRSRSRPSQHPRRQDSLPRSWKPSSTEYDSNREYYGFNLPRQVSSNKFTRDLQIDGMDMFDVRLAQVVTGGLNNWGLRSLANRKHIRCGSSAINWLTASAHCFGESSVEPTAAIALPYCSP